MHKNDGLKRQLEIDLKMKSQLEHLNHREIMMREIEMYKPASVRMFEEMEGSLAYIRKGQAEIDKLLEFSRPSSQWLYDINRASSQMASLISREKSVCEIVAEKQLAHRTWQEMLGLRCANLHMAASGSVFAAERVAAASEHLYSAIEFDLFRQKKEISYQSITGFEHALSNVTAGYERLGRSFQTLADITHLPSFVLPGAAQEIFIGGYAAKQVCITDEVVEDDTDTQELTAEIRKETAECHSLLLDIAPALARPYVGARDAFNSNNADRTRHILSSLRELWSHLLKHLAPDEAVLKWIPGNNLELTYQGRPTRKARVLYVCRNLNHEPLSDFVFHDTQALVKLMDFLNRVHELEPTMSDAQLNAILLRTESWIMYLIKIHKTTNQPVRRISDEGNYVLSLT